MNIGTTMTAWLAAFKGSAEARQTALAHTLFNVAGTLLIIPFFVPAILPMATAFFPRYADAAVVDGVTASSRKATPRTSPPPAGRSTASTPSAPRAQAPPRDRTPQERMNVRQRAGNMTK